MVDRNLNPSRMPSGCCHPGRRPLRCCPVQGSGEEGAQDSLGDTGLCYSTAPSGSPPPVMKPLWAWDAQQCIPV